MYLAKCSKLKVLDLTGLTSITNEGIYAFLAEEKGVEQGVLGLRKLKLSGVDKITDHPISKFCCRNRGLEVIELCKCSGLTLSSIEQIVKTLNCLKVLNVNMIPKLNLNSLKDILEQKPWLKVIQFAIKSVNIKDNGLRIPLPPKSDKKIKRKTKGKKSKK